MTDNFTNHHLSAECFADKTGRAIMLTQQDGTDDPHTVVLHTWQLRATCEHFGIIASDPQALRTIAMLTRRLLVLRDRIDHLSGYMNDCSDTSHANLDYEIGFIDATADIANEFCMDLPGTAMPAARGPGANAGTVDAEVNAVQAPCAPSATETAPADQPSLI